MTLLAPKVLKIRRSTFFGTPGIVFKMGQPEDFEIREASRPLRPDFDPIRANFPDA